MRDESRRHVFDEALLSGYLDGELTQAEEQRVRIHLEDHPDARALLDEMQRTRAATMTTRLKVPQDIQWDERPRGPLSLLTRRLGGLMLIAWTVAVAAYGLWQFFTSPEHLVEKLVAASAVSGFGLLFVSVLLDRVRDARTDRYRRVEK